MVVRYYLERYFRISRVWIIPPGIPVNSCGTCHRSYCTKSYGIFIKMPEAAARKVRAPGATFQRYEAIFKQAVFKVEDEKRLRLRAFQPLLKQAVRFRVG